MNGTQAVGDQFKSFGAGAGVDQEPMRNNLQEAVSSLVEMVETRFLYLAQDTLQKKGPAVIRSVLLGATLFAFLGNLLYGLLMSLIMLGLTYAQPGMMPEMKPVIATVILTVVALALVCWFYRRVFFASDAS